MKTSFLNYSNRLEINTPICHAEKQHLCKVGGKWASVFSWVRDGKRVYKCRQIFSTDEQAASYWVAVTSNY